MATTVMAEPQYVMFLIMALAYAEAHREQLEREHLGEELVRGWLSALRDQ